MRHTNQFHVSPGSTAPRKGRGVSVLSLHRGLPSEGGRPVVDGLRYVDVLGTIRRVDRLTEAQMTALGLRRKRTAPKGADKTAPKILVGRGSSKEHTDAEASMELHKGILGALRDKAGRFLPRRTAG